MQTVALVGSNLLNSHVHTSQTSTLALFFKLIKPVAPPLHQNRHHRLLYGLRVLAGQFTAPSNFYKLGTLPPFLTTQLLFTVFRRRTTFNHNNGTLKIQLHGLLLHQPRFSTALVCLGFNAIISRLNNINTSLSDSFITEAGGGTPTILGNVNIDQSYVKDIILLLLVLHKYLLKL